MGEGWGGGENLLRFSVFPPPYLAVDSVYSPDALVAQPKHLAPALDTNSSVELAPSSNLFGAKARFATHAKRRTSPEPFATP